ncbi:MAG TPA: hypothetical protein VN418_04375 [Gammaproteobacteria bacterium]|nr:hypothetical protein [Gammaproteobacteria bacterium]
MKIPPYIVVLLTGLAALPAHAVDTLHFYAASIRGSGWELRDIHLDVDLPGGGADRLALSISQLQFPKPLHGLHGLKLECPLVMAEDRPIGCQNGLLSLNSPMLDRKQGKADLGYDRRSGEIHFALQGFGLAKGNAGLSGSFTPRQDWRVQFQGESLDIARLPQSLGDFFEWPKDYTVKGGLSLTAQLAGHGLQLGKIETTGKLSALHFTETSGQQAAQNLSSDFMLTLKPGERWQFQVRLAPHQGQLYVAPMFVEFSGEEVKLDADGEWSKERITLSRLMLDHPSVVQAEAQVALSRNPLGIQAATLKLNTPKAGQFYQRYLQAMLSGTAFEALQGDGALAATLQYSDRGLEFIKTDLKNFNIKDQQGRYELHSLNGSLAWTRGNTPMLSDFQWQGGSVYKLTLGAAKVQAESVNGGFNLPGGVQIPLLDGVLKMDSAKLENMGLPNQRIELTGALTPVSMSAFSNAMEWPNMNGKLSGIIPALSYSQGKLEIGGALLMKVFDGDVVVRNLSLADPLGTTPVLTADVDMDNLDLDTLTQTFSFGRIQGRLNGTVHDLRMENWNPVAFDARFATPEGDTSRHRISQKAVDSLSSLGGAGGVLSRSFLRFFEEFSYNRLGLTCRLQHGVCTMDGVEQANKGYYIVKGGGIPRIDVIGYAKEVDWDVFLERLIQATQSEGPVVQ